MPVEHQISDVCFPQVLQEWIDDLGVGVAVVFWSVALQVGPRRIEEAARQLPRTTHQQIGMLLQRQERGHGRTSPGRVASNEERGAMDRVIGRADRAIRSKPIESGQGVINDLPSFAYRSEWVIDGHDDKTREMGEATQELWVARGERRSIIPGAAMHVEQPWAVDVCALRIIEGVRSTGSFLLVVTNFIITRPTRAFSVDLLHNDPWNHLLVHAALGILGQLVIAPLADLGYEILEFLIMPCKGTAC
mmetsp:Transcript_118748/g.378709  ORF Transcript_118748/g.378709 Transcript_118748/m.378709 type:complete len:248 (+) Transcript_118748:764-1507(+)